ncbi:Non-specific lipid-transfer protein [Hibiscus syriacus]|uniref:Non-specific lipid-transfer protein n=1 Tax=Hibiscus syriacus TaxID=106335 RepID=A0A6A2XL88_HIBSY|nr:Non-specific lipid-transfer protein [Hibiscus syriacus]
MASSMSLKLACVLVVCLAVVGAPLAQGTINCGEVTSKLAPCIPYLKGPGDGAPPPACCSGIKTLNGEAQTTPDRQAA